MCATRLWGSGALSLFVELVELVADLVYGLGDILYGGVKSSSAERPDSAMTARNLGSRWCRFLRRDAIGPLGRRQSLTKLVMTLWSGASRRIELVLYRKNDLLREFPIFQQNRADVGKVKAKNLLLKFGGDQLGVFIVIIKREPRFERAFVYDNFSDALEEADRVSSVVVHADFFSENIHSYCAADALVPEFASLEAIGRGGGTQKLFRGNESTRRCTSRKAQTLDRFHQIFTGNRAAVIAAVAQAHDLGRKR